MGLETVPFGDAPNEHVAVSHHGEIELFDPASSRIRQRYNVPYGAHLFVTDGQVIDSDAGAVRVGHLQQAGRQREGRAPCGSRT